MNAADVARGLKKARESGGAWVACCPCHEDKNPSLSLRDAEGQGAGEMSRGMRAGRRNGSAQALRPLAET
jgi:hypothetical protein